MPGSSQRGNEMRTAELQELQRDHESRAESGHGATQGRELRGAVGDVGACLKARWWALLHGDHAGSLSEPREQGFQRDVGAGLKPKLIRDFPRGARAREHRRDTQLAVQVQQMEIAYPLEDLRAPADRRCIDLVFTPACECGWVQIDGFARGAHEPPSAPVKQMSFPIAANCNSLAHRYLHTTAGAAARSKRRLRNTPVSVCRSPATLRKNQFGRS